MMLCGLRIVTNIYMRDVEWKQMRFPRSKKKRIRKKWSKNKNNFRMIVTPWNTYFRLGDTIVMHPQKLVELQRSLAAIERINCCPAPITPYSIF